MNAKAWFKKGVAAQSSDPPDLKEAIRCYTEAIQLDNRYAEAYNKRGWIMQQHGEMEAALRDFDTAIRLKPKDAVAHNNRGWTYFQMEHYQEAQQNFAEAMLLKPGYSEPYVNMGKMAMTQRELEDAVAFFTFALDIDSDHVEALHLRALSLAAMQYYEEALQDYDAVIRLNPDVPELWFERGNALLGQKRYADALKSYDGALRLKPDYADALRNRGVVYREMGERQKALDDMQAAQRAYLMAGDERMTLSMQTDLNRIWRNRDRRWLSMAAQAGVVTLAIMACNLLLVGGVLEGIGWVVCSVPALFTLLTIYAYVNFVSAGADEDILAGQPLPDNQASPDAQADSGG